jgi:hypothetical protein
VVSQDKANASGVGVHGFRVQGLKKGVGCQIFFQEIGVKMDSAEIHPCQMLNTET